MNSVDIAVVVIVGIAVLAVAGILIYKKIRHKGGCCDCGCGCSGCDKCNHGK